MTGKIHAEIGIVTFIGLCDKLPEKFTYTGIVIVGIASLLPDIDHPKGILNKYILPFKNKNTKIIIYLILGILFFSLDFIFESRDYVFRILGVTFMLIAFSSHRDGITHSVFGLIIFCFCISYFGDMYNIKAMNYYVMIGYGMHLIADMFTTKGIPIFYPFRTKKYKFPVSFSTGSKVGKFVEEFIMITGLMYIVYRIPFIL